MKTEHLVLLGVIAYLWYKRQPTTPTCYPSTYVGPLPQGAGYCPGGPTNQTNLLIDSSYVIDGVYPQPQPGAPIATGNDPNAPMFPNNQYY